MPKFMIGARGHDFGRQTPEQLFQAIGRRALPAPSWRIPRPSKAYPATGT